MGRQILRGLEFSLNWSLSRGEIKMKKEKKKEMQKRNKQKEGILTYLTLAAYLRKISKFKLTYTPWYFHIIRHRIILVHYITPTAQS